MVRESKNLKDEVETLPGIGAEYEDIQVMIQMGYEENDSSLIPEIEEMLEQFKETLEKMRMKLLLSGEYDHNNAILRLNAGGRRHRSPVTGAACFTACTAAGLRARALRPMCWISWTG